LTRFSSEGLEHWKFSLYLNLNLSGKIFPSYHCLLVVVEYQSVLFSRFHFRFVLSISFTFSAATDAVKVYITSY
jgi:hypothetical protein